MVQESTHVSALIHWTLWRNHVFLKKQKQQKTVTLDFLFKCQTIVFLLAAFYSFCIRVQKKKKKSIMWRRYWDWIQNSKVELAKRSKHFSVLWLRKYYICVLSASSDLWVRPLTVFLPKFSALYTLAHQDVLHCGFKGAKQREWWVKSFPDWRLPWPTPLLGSAVGTGDIFTRLDLFEDPVGPWACKKFLLFQINKTLLPISFRFNLICSPLGSPLFFT